MRVAVVTQYFPTSVQPWAGHSAYQTLRCLTRRCELKVFYPEARYPAFLTPKSHPAGALDRTYQPPDVAVEYIPYPVLPVVSRPLNGWSMFRSLLPHVARYHPDVILNYVVYPDGYAAVRVGRRLGIPVVLTAIGSDLNRISDPLSGVLTRSALRQASFVTTVSHDLLKTAHHLGADAARSGSILNGCDTSIFFPRDQSNARRELGLAANENGAAKVIVYVGRFDVRKGLLELVEAVSRLSTPAVRCFLVGSGPDLPLLLAAIKKFGVEDKVILVPACPTAQIALWMAAADLITLPSYKEGCPNVVIEALASGRPVVATKVGGIPELMDDRSGRLVEPKDIASLSLALDEVLQKSWNASEIAAHHHRSWSEVGDDVSEVLRGALEGR